MKYSLLTEAKPCSDFDCNTISCNLEVSKRYGVDPEATMIVNNMISYLVNMPARKLAKVGYIGKEDNILKEIAAKYEMAKAADADNYDVLVIGENEITEAYLMNTLSRLGYDTTKKV